MKLIEAQALIESTLAEEIPAAQITLRGISKNYKYKVPEALVRVIFEELEKYRNYLNNGPQFDTLMRLANLTVWTKTAKSHKVILEELLFVGLQHDSGKVRQNARALNQNYSRFLSNEKEPVEFLHKLEQLIKKYEPENAPIYVDRAKPSVYKSLVLTWHDTMMSHRLWERLNYLERMMELDIPPYAYQSDDEDDGPTEEYYTREDWKDYLEDFVACDDWCRARELLNIQEHLSIQLLKQALADNTIEGTYSKQIIRFARSSNPQRLADEVLMELGADIWARYEESRLELVQRTDKIARAIQTIDNNAVIKTTKGNPFSRMLSCAALQEAWRTKQTLIDLVPLLECFTASHLAVDEVIDELLLPADRERIAFYNEHAIELPLPTDFATPRQVAHYILDWLIQINYRLFLRKTPRQLAAVAWHIVDRRNPGLMLPGLENRKFAAFGGWPNSSGLCQLSQSLNIDLEQQMADPRVLTISSLDEALL